MLIDHLAGYRLPTAIRLAAPRDDKQATGFRLKPLRKRKRLRQIEFVMTPVIFGGIGNAA